MPSAATVTDVRAYEVLPDGTELFVRPVEPRDRELVLRGFAQLSSDSRYQRYFTYRQALSADELRALTESDGQDALALGVVSYDGDGLPQPLGLARYVRLADEPDVAEAAVTVVDAMQGRGLGKLLLHQLVRAARAHGIQRLRGHVLDGNLAMHKLVHSFDLHAHVLGREPGSEQYELCLDALTSAPASSPSALIPAGGTMPAS